MQLLLYISVDNNRFSDDIISLECVISIISSIPGVININSRVCMNKFEFIPGIDYLIRVLI